MRKSAVERFIDKSLTENRGVPLNAEQAEHLRAVKSDPERGPLTARDFVEEEMDGFRDHLERILDWLLYESKGAPLNAEQTERLRAEQPREREERASEHIRAARNALAQYDKLVGDIPERPMPLRLMSARQEGYDDETRQRLKLPSRQ